MATKREQARKDLGPITDRMLVLARQIGGRDPTPQEAAEYRDLLARGRMALKAGR